MSYINRNRARQTGTNRTRQAEISNLVRPSFPGWVNYERTPVFPGGVFRKQVIGPKKQHSEQEIISALKQVEAGRTVDDVARECGVSQATIYAWKARYGGLEVSEANYL